MFKLLAPVICAALLSPTMAAAAPPKLASHSAVYKLTLGETRDRSVIYDLVGQMVVSTDINCGGLVFEQRLIMEFSDDAGNRDSKLVCARLVAQLQPRLGTITVRVWIAGLVEQRARSPR